MDIKPVVVSVVYLILFLVASVVAVPLFLNYVNSEKDYAVDKHTILEEGMGEDDDGGPYGDSGAPEGFRVHRDGSS